MPILSMVLAKPVESRILVIRQHKVILDSELAELYGVEVKRLNEQVKRNIERFPRDFMFQLSAAEYRNLRSQFATSNFHHGGRRHLPFAFTEHGAIMVATVLNSNRAVKMSVFVVRAFVRLREVIAMNRELEVKLGELERQLAVHDGAIHNLFDSIRRLTAPAPRKAGRIGFQMPAKTR